jgi:CRP/FNR family transcriptional regulator
MEVLGRRLRYLGEQVENLMVCDVSTRLMKLLLHLCLFNADSQPLCRVPVKLPITLSQSQMASMTGSCQQTISETLKNLQDEGLISMDRKEITILDPLDFMNRLY